jgi:type II secretory pathway pseudopilin PulG
MLAGSSSRGFTMLEIMLVLFLIVGMLSLVIPRISIGDNLGSVARRWVGALKSFQEMAMMTQKTVRLYVDMDRGMYWPMVIDGKEEKIPLDPTWAMPITLPETIRFADIQIGATRKESGRIEIFFYPNGRIDQATVHLTDVNNDIMGVFVEPVTSMIRLTDHRIDPPQPKTIPDRLRPLLQPITPGLRPGFPAGVTPGPRPGFPAGMPK